MEKKNNTGLRIAIIIVVILLIIVVAVDLVASYLPSLEKVFGKTVNNITSKEVTVTDKGIADAVDKLYDATVIVEVGENEDNLAGWGSGFVYKTDKSFGYILTNHHVVDNANYIKIVYSDESYTEGKIVGSDKYNDVAVIKVPVNTVLKTAEIGKSEDVKVGDTVFAIGTPVSIDYSFTVTRGILSGKNRLCSMSDSKGTQSIFGYYQNQTEQWYISLLQIDASINSGNSGGPLANSNGEVIGINNSKLSSGFSSGSSIENIGFSIPIEDAMVLADELVEHGNVTRPLLGVSMTTIEAAKKTGMKIDSSLKYGAVVSEVSKGGSADKAGIRANDVIVKFGDFKIENYKYLKYYLYRYRVGDKVKAVINRDGKEIELNIELKKEN